MIEDKVRTFIIEELSWDGTPNELTSDYPLIDRHVLDSLGIVQLVSFLEDEFGIEIEDEELVPDHFGTVGSIASLVQAKRTP
jgi:acyl carrier protein